MLVKISPTLAAQHKFLAEMEENRPAITAPLRIGGLPRKFAANAYRLIPHWTEYGY